MCCAAVVRACVCVLRALRMALKDRKVAKLVQASQDVLTLLSQEGIYMEDLRPDMARPEIWRSQESLTNPHHRS